MDKGTIDASYVRRIYHPVNFKSGVSEQELLETIERGEVNMLCMSMTYDSYFIALQLARAAKNLNPELVTVFGGPHIDEVYDRKVMRVMPQLAVLPKHNDVVDFVVAGEGEMILLEIIKDSVQTKDPLSLKKRISEKAQSYCSLQGKGKIIFSNDTGSTDTIETNGEILSLEKLPLRRRDLADDEHDFGFTCFKDEGGRLVKSTSAMTHRGCKGMCIFCSEAEPYHHRSVDHLLFEIERLKSEGYRGVFFDDSTFHDYEEIDELIECLGNTNLQFGGLTRFDKLQDSQQVRKLAESGFVYFYCAVEQYDDLSLKKMGKQMRILQIERALDNLKENEIHLGVSILFGFPFETKKSIEDTLTFVARKCKEGYIDYVSMSLLTFHPKTACPAYLAAS